MTNKMVYVDEAKWIKFKKWCVSHDTTITKELDKFLTNIGVDKNGCR